MHNVNEIKKALYREKPVAIRYATEEDVFSYGTTLKDGTELHFDVPTNDMGDAEFEEEMDAHLLIRWLKTSGDSTMSDCQSDHEVEVP